MGRWKEAISAYKAKEVREKSLRDRVKWKNSRRFNRIAKRLNKLILNSAERGHSEIKIKVSRLKNWQIKLIAEYYEELGYEAVLYYGKYQESLYVKW